MDRGSNVELYELVEGINEDLDSTDYSILVIPFEDFAVVREDENGDWEVVGDFEEWDDHGDQFEASDPIGKNRDDDYLVASKPYGDRMLIYDHSED